ncbi:MAG: hypothetical protein ACOYOV_15130, partial [Bacteroidales bacterium]
MKTKKDQIPKTIAILFVFFIAGFLYTSTTFANNYYLASNKALDLEGSTSTASTTVAPITTISSVSICDGSTTVDVPITVADFSSNVASISLMLNYSSAELGLPSVLYNPLNLSFQVPSPGIIKLAGIEPSPGSGFPLSGTTLFTIRFTKLTPITSGTLSFNDDLGTSCEYSEYDPLNEFAYKPFIDSPMLTYYIDGNVTIKSSPSVSVNSPAICASALPASITAVPLPAAIYTYAWTYPSGASNPGNTASFSATVPGTYSVTVSGVNACTATASGTLTVYPLPTATITPNGPTTFFAGGSVVLTSSSGISYLWSNSLSTASITVTTSGNFSVRVTDVHGCQASSSTTVVTVNPAPGQECDPVVYVNSFQDDGSSGTLRDAIARVCNNGNIYFDNIDGRTITLYPPNGELIINKNLNFNYSNCTNKSGVTISGTGTLFTINLGVTLTLTECTKFTISGPIVNNAGVNGLLLNSGASLIYNYCNLSATAKRILSPGWHLFGSPFMQNTGASLAKLIPSGGSAPLM